LVNRENNVTAAAELVELLVYVAAKAADAGVRHQHVREVAIGIEIDRFRASRVAVALGHHMVLLVQFLRLEIGWRVTVVTDQQVNLSAFKLSCDQVRI
jgi:hypothetical protein